jgi:hypothetical protein
MKKSMLFFVLLALGATSQSLLAHPELPPGSLPDGGTTAALLAAGAGGLIWARRYFRR